MDNHLPANELDLDTLKERALEQETRISELKQRSATMDKKPPLLTDAVYDMYYEGEYLYLSVDLPGVIEHDLLIHLGAGEIHIQGEFPVALGLEKAEFTTRKRSHGPFDYTFLLPPEKRVKSYEWQLVNGVLQLKIQLVGTHELTSITE